VTDGATSTGGTGATRGETAAREVWVHGEVGADGRLARISAETAGVARTIGEAMGADTLGVVVGAEPDAPEPRHREERREQHESERRQHERPAEGADEPAEHRIGDARQAFGRGRSPGDNGHCDEDRPRENGAVDPGSGLLHDLLPQSRPAPRSTR
jgi:hypothetical protein